MSRHSKKVAPKTSRPALGQGSLPGFFPPQKEREEAAKKAPATKKRGRQTSLALDLNPSTPAPSWERPQEKQQDHRQGEIQTPSVNSGLEEHQTRLEDRPLHHPHLRLQEAIQPPAQEFLETTARAQTRVENRLREHTDDHLELQAERSGAQLQTNRREPKPPLSPPQPAATPRLPWERYLDSEEEGDEPQSKQEALRRSMQKLLGRDQPREVNRVQGRTQGRAQDPAQDWAWDQERVQAREENRDRPRALLHEQTHEPAPQNETRRQPKLAHLPTLLQPSDFGGSPEPLGKSESPRAKWRKPAYGPGRLSDAELLGSDLELGLLRLLHSDRRAARLTPSRRMLLISQVSGMELREGALEAAVSDGLGRRYRIQLRLETFSAAQWARVARSVSTRPTLLAQLRDAHLSWQLCVLAPAEGLDLLPPKLSDLRHACTCGQRNGRCQHFFALCLAFAQHLAENPSAILVLRGANAAELVSLVERVAPESAKVGDLGDSESGSESESGDGALEALGTSDPFAAPNAPLADWSLLDSSSPTPPLGAPEFWRHPAKFKEMSERLIHLARQNFSAKSLLS